MGVHRNGSIVLLDETSAAKAERAFFQFTKSKLVQHVLNEPFALA